MTKELNGKEMPMEMSLNRIDQSIVIEDVG